VGANGKSVFLKILREIVGPENTSSVQISQFANKFQRAHLQGKLLNLITELPEGGQIPDAVLKAIVSGETITCENKGLPPFEMTPFCTIVAATNHLPHTRDFSEALFRRAIIIRFNRVFAESEQDRFLAERLKGELPGIFYRAVKSLEDLFRDNGFVEPQESKDLKAEWRVDVDQCEQFVADCCLLAPSSVIESGRLYTKYCEWAVSNGVHQRLTQRGLSARLKRRGVVLSRGAGGVRLLKGIEYVGSE
jgi:P4 family phage/plasmid primase-like protien